MSSARVQGHLGVNEGSVLTILEDEARTSARAAGRVALSGIQGETPIGKAADGDIHPGLLSKSHKLSVTRTAYGTQARIKRAAPAWYGRVVETGRKAGRGRTGRKVSASKANPFVDRALDRADPVAAQLLEEGAGRAAARIEARAVTS